MSKFLLRIIKDQLVIFGVALVLFVLVVFARYIEAHI